MKKDFDSSIVVVSTNGGDGKLPRPKPGSHIPYVCEAGLADGQHSGGRDRWAILINNGLS